MAGLIPELYVSDLGQSLKFYVQAVGFCVRYDRPEERFAFLDLGDAELMLEQPTNHKRTWLLGELSFRFGRGVNFSITVPDVQATYIRMQQQHPAWIVVPLEDRWYRQEQAEVGNRQFVTRDPDGYLLRLVQDLGVREA